MSSERPFDRPSRFGGTADGRRRTSGSHPGLLCSVARSDMTVQQEAERARARRQVETEFGNLKEIAADYGLTKMLPDSASVDFHDPTRLTVRIPDLTDPTGRRGERKPYEVIKSALAVALAETGVNLERELAERRNEN